MSGGKMPCVLSIAGSDCSGGAGIQADLKTMAAHGVYGMAAVTAVTAQNTLGVRCVQPVPDKLLEEQLACVFEDIMPDAVKIGMLTDERSVHTVAAALSRYQARHVVIDPVMVSTSGARLLGREAVQALTEVLFPLAEVITPNLPEARALGKDEAPGDSAWGQGLRPDGTQAGTAEKAGQDREAGGEAGSTQAGTETMARTLAARLAAQIPGRNKPWILVKGGHLEKSADDYLWREGRLIRYAGERIHNPNTHGTGCILSTAIACGLACGMDVEQSVGEAKEFLRALLQRGLRLGHGNGPLL